MGWLHFLDIKLLLVVAVYPPQQNNRFLSNHFGSVLQWSFEAGGWLPIHFFFFWEGGGELF